MSLIKEETEVKDLRWAKEEIKKERNLLNDKRYEREVDDLTTGVLLGLKKALNILNQLDEPEVLSQEWIDEHSNGASRSLYVWADDLKDLLVAKQEEVDRAYKDGYEKGKQHTFYKGYREGLADKESESETVADVLVDFYKDISRGVGRMKITVFSKPNCGACDITKQWLDNNDIEYTAIDAYEDADAMAEIQSHGFMSWRYQRLGFQMVCRC